MFVGYADALGRDLERGRDGLGRIDRCPAGAAIMAGTSVDIDRARLAELLGFPGLAENTFDAVLAQDALLETMWVLAITSADVARLAEDLMILSSTEIAIASVPDRYSGTSSIAVHKRNPYAPQLMKGAGAEAIGSLMTAFMIEKGPTGMPMQDRAYALRAVWAGFDDLERGLRWAGDIVAHLGVDTAQAERLADRYWATSTDVATMLVDRVGLPWRTAHQIVGAFVRDLQRRGVEPAQATVADLQQAATDVAGESVPITQADIDDALRARSFVARRTLVGGPAPSEVARQIDDRLRRIDEDASWLASVEGRIRAADTRLDEAVDGWIGPAPVAPR
jgi:argininosuccinate lyase